MTRRHLLLAATVPGPAMLALPGAHAQAPMPVRLRGTIAALDGNVLSVATREGTRVAVTLADTLTVAALRRVEPREITIGTALGVVAEPGDGETLRAVAITVLPPGARITERQFAWDLAPNTSMNNGPAIAVVESSSGHDVTLSINGRSVLVRITPDTALLMPIAATRDDLKPGMAVFINATPGANGALAADRVTVAKDGVAPAI
jgi:hypothetical protein